MSILGHPATRREDPAFLTVGGSYVDDLDLENPLHVTYARSVIGHGIITSIDVEEARSAPGVVAVFTATDIAQLGTVPNVVPAIPEAMRRPFLATDRVRHVGQPIAAVIAETPAEAVDAAELVIVDYEMLDTVVDVEDAVRDEVLLFDEHGTNVVLTIGPEVEADFAGCEVVVAEQIDNQRLTAAPIEPRAGAAWWTDDGRLVHYSACQGAHPTRDLLATIYQLDHDMVRVVVPDVGGGFGAKSRTYPDELLLGWYSKELGRPVKWTETRSENLATMPHGRGQRQQAKLGGTSDGLITAYQLDVIQDAGAYPLIGAVLPNMTRRMLTGTYHIDNVGFRGTTVVTNTVSTTAYRGAGRPEATVAIERMIDRYAAEIGMDPAEVRAKNLVPRFVEPYTTGIGTVYDVGDYPEALRLALKASDYEELRAEQARRRSQGGDRLLGIGIGCYVEITAGAPTSEYGSVQLGSDGRITVVSGATAFGQGHATTWSMIVADALGVDTDRIEVVSGDTDRVPRGALTVGSRSVQVAGSALVEASDRLVETARQRAADLLEARLDDVVFTTNRSADLVGSSTGEPAGGRFHVTGSPAVSIGWAEIADGLDEPLIASSDYSAEMPTFPSGAHVAVVEVDRETGATTLVRLVAADDAGRLINPLLAEGQVHGGIAQGVAQVLFEAVNYDEYGNLLTGTLMDYLVASAADLPSFEVVHLETPTWVNALGAKGMGESGTIGAIPAVYNAVIDAVSHLGITHLKTPLTPQKMWEAMERSVHLAS